MKTITRGFACEECGAISAEWVVLVAGVLMLGVAVFFAVDSGTMDLAQGTFSYLTGAAD